MFEEGTPSSPPTSSSTPEYALAYYKAQYETLESELAEFQASSQELEAELEKDVEAAEARERLLQQKAEELNYKVVEWQNKYKESKKESGEAERRLQQEITALRGENRELQHRLRDVEVVNDDFERQARNTEGSLQDMERNWHLAIERGVMMEEEIRIGEQEREQLRIETQRLKGDLSDLRIEADVLRDKLQRAEARGKGQMDLPPLLASNNSFTAPSSPQPFLENEESGMELGANSSPFVHTPRTLTSDSSQGTPTPPSPPISDRSSATANSGTNPQAATSSGSTTPKAFRTPLPSRGSRIRAPSGDLSITPKPPRGQSKLNDTGAPAARPARATTPSVSRVRKEEMRNKFFDKALPAPPERRERGLPTSSSLIHMRAITAQMKRLELRVQNARSKLPEPKVGGASMSSGVATPPLSGLDSITIRSRKRTVGSASVSSSVLSGETGDDTPSLPGGQGQKQTRRISTSGISKLSLGAPSTRPPSEAKGEFARPHSRSSAATSNGYYNTATSIGASTYSQTQNGGFAIPARAESRMTADRPDSRVSDRPQSRGSATHSTSTYERPASRSSVTSGLGVRPASRSSLGRQTPLGQLAESRRPRSSIGQTGAMRPDFSKTVGPGSTPGYGSLKGHKGSQSVSVTRINYGLVGDGEEDRDREARARENRYNATPSILGPPSATERRVTHSSLGNFDLDGAGSERGSDYGGGGGNGGGKAMAGFSQSVSGIPERRSALPRRTSSQMGQGQSPGTAIPVTAALARSGHVKGSPSLARSTSTRLEGLRGPNGVGRSPSTSISGPRTMPGVAGNHPSRPVLTRPGSGRSLPGDRMARLNEGREPKLHDGEMMNGKGGRVTVHKMGVVGRGTGQAMREEQKMELERKRLEKLERQARAKGLGLERGGSMHGSRLEGSRPGSSGSGLGGSVAGSAQSSPRKMGNFDGQSRMNERRWEEGLEETF